MSSKDLKLRVTLFLVLLVMVVSVPGFAGSAVIGSVAGSMNATAGGQALLPNTTIFSGDSVQVKNGAAVVAMSNGSRMALGRDTVASFLRESNEVTLLLAQGNVTIFHPDDRVGLRVKAGEFSILPAKGFKTLGEVAMLNGAVVVTAKEGSLRVEGNGPAVEVTKGKTITLLPKKVERAPQAGVSQKLGGADTLLDAGALGAGVVAAILAGIGISRSNDARDAANKADSDAIAATSAANAATSAANAATSAAAAADADAISAGCAINNLGADLFVSGVTVGIPSPFTPPAGVTCPPNPSGIG